MLRGTIGFVEASTTGAGLACIQAARTAGLQTILFTRASASNGPDVLSAATDVIEIDTNDVDALLAGIKHAAYGNDLRGVMTTSDFHVKQTALLADALRLPGMGLCAAECCHDKASMRDRLQARGVGQLNPVYQTFSAYDLNDEVLPEVIVKYPCIGKRVDGNDSKDITLVASPKDLSAYVRYLRGRPIDSSGHRYNGRFLLEEHIGGDEFSLEYVAYGPNKYVPIGVFIKEQKGGLPAPYIKMGAAYPYAGEAAPLLAAAGKAILRAIAADVGVFDIDCKIENGRVRALEVNGRIVGDQMGSQLIPLATGLDLANLAIRLAIGESVAPMTRETITPIAIFRILPTIAGSFRSIRNLTEMRGEEGIIDVNVLARPGTQMRPASSNADVIGSVVATGDTIEGALQRAKRVARKAIVEVGELPTVKLGKT